MHRAAGLLLNEQQGEGRKWWGGTAFNRSHLLYSSYSECRASHCFVSFQMVARDKRHFVSGMKAHPFQT